MNGNKLPDGVVLAMEQVVGDDKPCLSCYFLKSRCPKDWRPESGVFTLSCTNDRDIIFREIGDSDE